MADLEEQTVGSAEGGQPVQPGEHSRLLHSSQQTVHTLRFTGQSHTHFPQMNI